MKKIIFLLIFLLFPLVANAVQFAGIDIPNVDIGSVGCDINYDYCADNGEYKVNFKQFPDTAETIKYSRQGYDFTFQPLSINYRNQLSQIEQIMIPEEVNASTDMFQLYYSNIFGANYTLNYFNLDNQLKEELILLDKPTPPQQYIIGGGNPTFDFDFQVMFPDLDIYVDDVLWDKKTLTTTSGEIHFKNSSGHTIYYLNTPEAVSENDSIRLTYELKKQGNSFYITIKTPYNWLNSTQYPVKIDPTVQFETVTVRGISIDALNQNTFIMAWCDATGYDMIYQVYDTNGTNLTGQIILDTTVSSCTGQTDQSIKMINESHYIIAWYSATGLLYNYQVFDNTYTNITGVITAYDDVGTSAPSQSTPNAIVLNDTHFIYARSDVDTIGYMGLFDYKGTQYGSWTRFGDERYWHSGEAINETHFIIGWYDDTDSDITTRVFDVNFNNITDEIDIDLSAQFEHWKGEIALFNESRYVVAWQDDGEDDSQFRIMKLNGTPITDIVDVDTAVGTSGKVASVTIISETKFAIFYNDDVDDDVSMAIYDSNGVELVGAFDVNDSVTSGYGSLEVFSERFYPNTKLFGDTIITAYYDTSFASYWKTYKSDGTLWDGLFRKFNMTYPLTTNNATVQNQSNITIQFELSFPNGTIITPTEAIGVRLNDDVIIVNNEVGYEQSIAMEGDYDNVNGLYMASNHVHCREIQVDGGTWTGLVKNMSAELFEYNAGDQNVKYALYNSSFHLIGNTSEFKIEGTTHKLYTYTFPEGEEPIISTGQTYYMCVRSDKTWYTSYDVSSGDWGGQYTESYGDWTATISLTTTDEQYDPAFGFEYSKNETVTNYYQWCDASICYANITMPDRNDALYNLTISLNNDGFNYEEEIETNSIQYGNPPPPPEDTCTPPAINNDWEITISDNCSITSNVDLGTGDLILTGDSGYFKTSAIILTNQLHYTPDDFDGDTSIQIISGGSISPQP